MDNENLNHIETFFDSDLNIKKILHSLVPEEKYNSSEEARVEYSDKLYRGLQDLKFYIKQIASLYFNYELKYCKEFFTKLEKELVLARTDYDRLTDFYRKRLSDLSEDLVKKVGENSSGYKFNRGVSFTEAKTVNELLHIMHQSLINDEIIFSSMPKIVSKTNDQGENITLYGIQKDDSLSIFENFPTDLECGLTDILSLKNQILIMIRDRGHALSIQIEKENGLYYVSYYIPKICNIILVNQLRGVHKITKEQKFTTGIFETDEINLCNDLIDFISKVPTDKEMFIEGGSCYKK